MQICRYLSVMKLDNDILWNIFKSSSTSWKGRIDAHLTLNLKQKLVNILLIITNNLMPSQVYTSIIYIVFYIHIYIPFSCNKDNGI
jgi:hypothetical protein